MNVLIAEDEADTRKLLVISLEDEGYRVFQAQDGLAARLTSSKPRQSTSPSWTS